MSLFFFDTAGLIALWERNDQWHGQAKAAFQTLISGRAKGVTTSHVLLECANAAARRPFRRDVTALRENLIVTHALIEPTSAEISEAWSDYHHGLPGAPGVVDLLSFSVMRRFGITDVLTNDKHFRTAGFRTLY